MTNLDAIAPQGAEITVGGETLTIMPLKVGQLPAFLRAITPVMQKVSADGVDWLTLFGEYGDNLLSSISIAIGKPREWVDELAADEAILLASKIIEVNSDFFIRAVLPRLETILPVGKQEQEQEQADGLT